MNTYQQLEHIFEEIAHLSHLDAITSWDEAVMMPAGGGEARADAQAYLQRIRHEKLANPQVGELIEQSRNLVFNNEWQAANYALMTRQYRKATALSSDLVAKITQATTKCEQSWRQMRANNNWHDFIPLFEEVVVLIRESANIRAEKFKLDPYDILIDDYSPNLTQAIIDPIFDQLKIQLPSLIAHIIDAQSKHPITPLNGLFPIAKQQVFSKALMSALGFNFNQGRFDTSHHPFCGGDPTDVRITTRYNDNEFISAAMGICHETGHARYEQGLPRQWLRQPVGHALGMAVHESQSLLVEMQACRSRAFMNFFAPLAEEVFGVQPGLNPENLYRIYTKVARSLIRVDADEVSYPLHIILRYEIEKELIHGKLTVRDLPERWHHAVQQYLQLSTHDNFKDGIMQDVHWPAGLFGYFPAYTLGSLTAAQLFYHAVEAHPDIPEQLAVGSFDALFQWLNTHIHSKGSSISFDKLISESTGEPLNPNYFINHIKMRYLKT